MTITHQQLTDILQDGYRRIHETRGEAVASEFLKQLFVKFARRAGAGTVPSRHSRPVQDLVEAAMKSMQNNTADAWSGNAAQTAWASLCSDLRTLALHQTDPGSNLYRVRDPLRVVYPLIADLPRKLLAASWCLLAEAAPVIVKRASDPIEVHPLIAFHVSAWNVPTREMYELYGTWQDKAGLPRHGQGSSVFDGWYDASGPIIGTGDLVAGLAGTLAEMTLRYAPQANPSAELFNVLFQGEWKATKAVLLPK